MTLTFRSKAFLSAAVAALPAFFILGSAPTAHAQYQIQGGGHVLDANPRLGSGGWNGNGTPHADYNVNNNNLWTGNVSGLNYFHGNHTGEFDTNTFAGNTGSSSFNGFNNISAPVNYAQRDTGAPTYTPVYNQGNYVGQPPSNYISTPGNTSYIPAPRISPLLPTGYDSRLELTNTDPTRGNLLTPGELNVAGPVDPSTGNQSMFSMSPLYGVRQDDGALPQDSFFNSKTTNNRQMTSADRAKMTPAQIEKMRDELNSTIVPTDQNGGTPGTPGDGTQSNTAVPGAVDVSKSQSVTSTLNNTALSNGQINSSVVSPQVGGELASGQGIQNQLLLPANKQSKQLKALEEKYAKDKEKLNDVQASDRFNQELRAQKTPTNNFDATKPDKAVGGGGAVGLSKGFTGGASNGADAGAQTPKSTDNTATATVKPTPKPIETSPDASADRHDYIVTSLATGIDAKGLSQLMQTAEEQMRQGKFTEAVDTYDTAQQVAPNNPFVSLGRGFAELGASYYGKADQDISRAIAADPAILAGRYDLKGFLGEDRIKFIHDDLEDIANHEKGARPLVLLSYIAHNGGDDATAARDLNEASKRGGYDQLIKTLREAWNLK